MPNADNHDYYFRHLKLSHQIEVGTVDIARHGITIKGDGSGYVTVPFDLSQYKFAYDLFRGGKAKAEIIATLRDKGW
jgi:hypothetical protein